MATASQRVFGITELLEQILLHLPPRDVLLLQRVNGAFRNVTTTSDRLQRKLFFKADLHTDHAPPADFILNPFLEFLVVKLEKGLQL